MIRITWPQSAKRSICQQCRSASLCSSPPWNPWKHWWQLKMLMPTREDHPLEDLVFRDPLTADGWDTAPLLPAVWCHYQRCGTWYLCLYLSIVFVYLYVYLHPQYSYLYFYWHPQYLYTLETSLTSTALQHCLMLMTWCRLVLSRRRLTLHRSSSQSLMVMPRAAEHSARE